jgi:tetratricopeptide (TPR) repeat protein
MKTAVKGLLTTFIITISLSLSFGQKGIDDGSKFGHGEDSIRCIKNLSLYREYVKQGNFAPAIAPWQIVYSECPKSSKYIFIDGVKMVTDAIDKETDAKNKALLVDSLMNIYDKRVKYYGQLGYVLGRKGLDFYKYSEAKPENFKIAYDYLKKALETERIQSGAQELFTFMQTSKDLYLAKSIEAGQVVNDYAFVSDLIDQNLKKAAEPNMVKAKEAVDQIFESSGAASCKDLVPYYTQKFKETPEDKEFIKKATSLLSTTKCNDSEIYFKMLLKLNSLEPTADYAYELANLNKAKENYDEASKYYKQAVDLQADKAIKARYYIEMGDMTRKAGNYPLARTYALNAIEQDPSSGVPYILIGHIYAAASKSCSEDEFEQKSVYWAAVDKFAKAKSVDASLTDQANELIETYKPHFPDNETIFFYGLKIGDNYTIKCWINEVTTVRSR